MSSSFTVIKSNRVIEKHIPAAAQEVTLAELLEQNAKLKEQLVAEYKRGHKEGLEQGTQLGRQSGFEAGAQVGAKQGREQGFSEGMEKGHQQGLEEGTKQTQAKLQEQFDLFAKLNLTLSEKHANLVKESEADLLKLAILIAERIVRDKVKEDDYIKNFVHNLLTVVVDKSNVVIRVNSKDAEVLQQCRQELISSQGIAELNIVNDPHLSDGDCIIETNSGNFDAKVCSQITQIKKHLSLE